MYKNTYFIDKKKYALIILSNIDISVRGTLKYSLNVKKKYLYLYCLKQNVFE